MLLRIPRISVSNYFYANTSITCRRRRLAYILLPFFIHIPSRPHLLRLAAVKETDTGERHLNTYLAIRTD